MRTATAHTLNPATYLNFTASIMTINQSRLVANAALDQLKDIYLVANTAAFLYEKLLATSTVYDLIRADTSTVINEFGQMATAGVSSLNELTLLYALYVALLNKDDQEAEAYINKKGVLNFEWFGDFYSINRVMPKTRIVSWPNPQTTQVIGRAWRMGSDATTVTQNMIANTYKVHPSHV